MSGIGIGTVLPFVYVTVKHGKPDEKSHADEIFHTFDIRIIVNQRKNFFDFAY
jgi:hypothetical protein